MPEELILLAVAAHLRHCMQATLLEEVDAATMESTCRVDRALSL